MPPVNLPTGPLAPETVTPYVQETIPEYRVKQMKIAKISSPNNRDNTAVLREADSITLVHSNGAITYPITSRVEYSTYYLYSLDMPYNVTGSNTTNATTILVPYHEQNFKISDFNATLNNANNNRDSKYRFVADYNGDDLPANISAIAGGFATKAQVQDFLEGSTGLASSRYTGQQLRAAMENEWTAGDISYGATPIVSNPQTYAAYFDWVGGTSPELIGYVAAHISYLIDQEGNIIPTTASEIELYNIQQTFADGTLITVDFENGEYISGDYANTTLGSLEGEQTIFRAAKQAKAVVSSRSGTNQYAESLTFSSSLDVQDLKFKAEGDVQMWEMVGIGSTLTVPYDSQSLSGDTTYSYSTSTYTLTFNDLPEMVVKYVAAVEVRPFDGQTPNSGQSASGYIFIEKQTAGSTTWTSIKQGSTVSLNANITTGTSIVTLDYTQFASGDKLRIRFRNNSTSNFKLDIKTISWYSIPEFLTGEITVDTSAPASAWYQSRPSDIPISQNAYWIAGHLDFNSIYGNAVQQDIAGSGLDPFYLPFTVEPGDQIRFTDLESRSYTIVEVRTPEQDGRLYLKLDNAIDAVSGLNNRKFTIRRFISNPTFIIYQAEKKSGETSGGVITPKYMTETVKEKLQSAIQKIKGGN